MPKKPKIMEPIDGKDFTEALHKVVGEPLKKRQVALREKRLRELKSKRQKRC